MADDSYKKVFLETHNQYREQHQAPPLVYSEDLCKAAQLWAEHMLEKRSLGHSDTENGENVYYSFSSEKKPLTGKEAVDSWYSEIKDYDFKKSGHQPKTGHFTQVVWKSSTELGVGLATDGKKVFVVGQYKTAGNITNAGYYEKNVLPKTGYDSNKKEVLETHNQDHEQHQAPPLVCSEDYDSYKKVFLETHNQYREQHQAPPLVYSEDLCKAAQLWAEHMLEKRSLGHSDTENGENVYYSFSSEKKPLTGKEAVDSWYSEIKDYDFKKSGHQPKTGHFTQVVWKSSTELGVGLATDGNTVFVVGQYKPTGNITNAGYYEKNVLPKTGYDSNKKEVLETHNQDHEQHQAPPLVCSEDYDSYKKVFLETHNQYREQHQAPPLVYSEDLCKAAQLWAEHMLEKRSLGHSDTENGENVYYSFSSEKKPLTGKEAVDSWYSEIKDYDFKKSGHQPKTGHFTQVVWKSSTELGVGLATDGNTVFVVGQYKPTGNITNAGYYEKNVLPKTGYDSNKKEVLETHNQDHEQHQAPPLVCSEDYDSYKKVFLETHNQYREQHQAPPLVYSEDLCKAAQLWAEHMLEKRSLGHSDTENGENVYYSFSSEKKPLTGKEAVDSWYSEIKDYDFKKSGHQPKTGHFTQVVWKSSTELGVGLATDGNTVFVVGQYKPTGNITNAGYYEKNVLPKTG